MLESPVTALRVEGGPVGKECMLVGLQDGSVLRLVVTNVFPIPLGLPKAAAAVVGLDLSLYHR